MNSQRNAAFRLEEEIGKGGAPPHGKQVPPLEEDANVDQALVNLPLMMDKKYKNRSFSKGPCYHHSSTNGHDTIPSYEASSKSGGCVPSPSTSYYYGFP